MEVCHCLLIATTNTIILLPIISDSLLHFDFDFVLNGSLFDSNRIKFLEGEIALYDSFEIKYLPNWIDWGSECSNINIK